MKKLVSIALLVLPVLAAAQKIQTVENNPRMETVKIADLKPISQSEGRVDGAVYADPSADPSARAEDLLSRLTFEEKLAMTGGWNKFLIHGVPRLGVRPVSMADASQGIRVQTALVKDPTVSYPGMLPLASTWNRELVAGMSSQLAGECRSHGVDILLGPGINMQRLSVGGRAYEYFGEDPFLTGSLCSVFIKNLQEGGVIACPKHFVANDQDFCRHIINYDVDERTLREIYLLPWEMAVKQGGALAMMTGNNSCNGYHCFMNRNLIQETMRDDFGFEGLVMTDWQNTGYYPDLQHLVLESGSNLMMPVNETFSSWVKKEIDGNPARKAEIEAKLDKMVLPIFFALFKMGIYDRPFNDPAATGSMEENKEIAYQVALEAPVLLKNEGGILPLSDTGDLLLMGATEPSSGTGSGFVKGYDHVSIEQGLKNAFGSRLTVDLNASDEAVRKAGTVLFMLTKPGGEGYDVPFEEPQDQLARLSQVLELNSNVVVLVNSCSSMPMEWAAGAKAIVWCYFLGQERGHAIASLLSGEANFSGKLPITLEKSFKDSPDPEFNYFGGEPYWQGNNQYKAYWLELKGAKPIPGFSEYVTPHVNVQREYKEGVFIGYRWADKTGMPCNYCFGEGLSYTTFEYKSIRVRNRLRSKGMVTVSVKVKNTGRREGKETVQVYVGENHPTVERPVKELKAFEKVSIRPGKTAKLRFELDVRSFQYWDEVARNWKMNGGLYTISAGGSSKELPLTKIVSLP